MAAGDKSYAAVAAKLKASCAKRITDGGAAAMKAVYAKMHLLTESSGTLTWSVKELDGKGLLDAFGPDVVVDEIVKCAKANGYFNAFMEAIWPEGNNRPVTFPVLASKSADEVDKVLAEATAYAVVLARLTKLLRDDYTIWKAIKAHLDSITADAAFQAKIKKKFTLFMRIKVDSVNPAAEAYIAYHAKREANPSFKIPTNSGDVGISANIMEATTQDWVNHCKDNAWAGFVLACYRVGSPMSDKTGAGPSRWSPDYKAIQLYPPLPEQWADLYSIWNLDFVVSTFPDWPYFAAKLLNTQVLGYNHSSQPRQTPASEYMYNRVISLYLHMHWVMFDRVEDHGPSIEWRDAELTKLWGTVNSKSATDYEQQVRAIEPSRKMPSVAWGITSFLGRLIVFLIKWALKGLLPRNPS
jgi:hypothetical protein